MMLALSPNECQLTYHTHVDYQSQVILSRLVRFFNRRIYIKVKFIDILNWLTGANDGKRRDSAWRK